MAPKVSETLLEHGRHFRDVDRPLNTPRVVDALRGLGATGFAEPDSPGQGCWEGVSCITSGRYYIREAAVKLNSKGQVTIPAELRRRHGFAEGDEVEVIEDGTTLRIVHGDVADSRGHRIVSRLRGRATTNRTTDELMALLRGE